MKNLLCILGFHDWDWGLEKETFWVMKKCYKCKKTKVNYCETWEDGNWKDFRFPEEIKGSSYVNDPHRTF